MFHHHAESIRPGALDQPSSPRADVRSGKAGSGRRGFSLVELVVVLAIAASAAAVGTFKYASAASRSRAEGAAHRILADLDAAQIRARVTSSAHFVVFDAAFASYRIGTAAQLSAGSAQRIDLAANPYRSTITVSGLPSDRVRFDAFGQPSGGGVITITSGDAQFTLTIDQHSGRANAARTR